MKVTEPIMGKHERRVYLGAIQGRYRKANRAGKVRIAVVEVERRTNVGKLRNTSQSIEPRAPAAKADDLPVISELSTAPHPRPISVEQSWALNPSATLFSYLMSS